MFNSIRRRISVTPLLLILAVLCASGVVIDRAGAAYFDANSLSASGVVRNLAPGNTLIYSFPVADQCHLGHDQIDAALVARMFVGQPVDVRYLPDDPDRAHLAGISPIDTQLELFLAVMSGVFVVAAIVLRLSPPRPDQSL